MLNVQADNEKFVQQARVDCALEYAWADGGMNLESTFDNLVTRVIWLEKNFFVAFVSFVSIVVKSSLC
jgi:hypothetical protein